MINIAMLNELSGNPAGSSRGGRIKDAVPLSGVVTDDDHDLLAGIKQAERGIARAGAAADIDLDGQRACDERLGGSRGGRRRRASGRFRVR